MRRSRSAIALALLLVTASCTDASAPAPRASTEADISLSSPVTVSLWHALTGPQQSALAALVAKFNATNGKGVTVTAQYQGNISQLYARTLAAIQAGGVPDMVQCYETQAGDYAKGDALIDLRIYRDSPRNGLGSRDDIFRTLYDASTFAQLGGRLLSWPFLRSLAAMYVNEDVLRDVGRTVPSTWEEFEATAKALTRKDASGRTTRYGFAFNPDGSFFNAQIYARGGSLTSADGKTVGWDGVEGVAVLEMYERMLNDGSAYLPRGRDWETDFAAGKLALYFSATSSIPFIKDVADRSGVRWSVAGLPQADPSRPRTAQFGSGVAVFKTSPERQLASWLFLRWLTEPEQTAQLAATAYALPVRASAAETGVLKEFWTKVPQARQAFDLMKTSVPEPNLRGQQEIHDGVLFPMLQDVIAGKAAPDAALRTAAAKANQILKNAD